MRRKAMVITAAVLTAFLFLGAAACSSSSTNEDSQTSGGESEVIQRIPSALAAIVFDEFAAGDDPDRIAELRRRAGFDPVRFFTGRKVDLDGDGKPEWIVRTGTDQAEEPLCTTHNCPMWVYRDDGGRYDQLLSDVAGYIEGVTVLTTSTRGHRDIKVQQHASAVQRDVVVYRFDGKRYQASECSSDTYEQTPAGDVIKAKTVRRACPLQDADFSVAGLEDGMALTQVRTILGAPGKVRTDKNELGGGQFVTLEYPGLEVFAADGQHASNVTLSTAAYTTARGLRVGDPESRMTELYGEPTGTYEDARDFADPKHEMRVIRVLVKNGRVTRINVGWIVD